ncbi:MAG: response regulator transcription factor, partial [Candidatus Hydrogenedentes bacterium]|nr:response regulator transcription factor [Candidatus Hydrogenedentota bacterium]
MSVSVEQRADAGASSYRFLVVEDEQAMRTFLQEVLRREGHECEVA